MFTWQELYNEAMEGGAESEEEAADYANEHYDSPNHWDRY